MPSQVTGVVGGVVVHVAREAAKAETIRQVRREHLRRMREVDHHLALVTNAHCESVYGLDWRDRVPELYAWLIKFGLPITLTALAVGTGVKRRGLWKPIPGTRITLPEPS